MKYYLRCLHAETLKLRRTMALWVVLAAPLLVHALILALFLVDRNPSLPPPDWDLIRQNIFAMWTTFTLPLLVTLLAALLAGMEHSQNHWKHLFALPLSRRAVVAAKWTMGAALIGLSSLVLVLATPITLFILRQFTGSPYQFVVLQFLRPGINFELRDLSILVETCRIAAAGYAASLFVLSIQTWISLRWQSFIVPNLVGVLAVIFNLGMMIAAFETVLKFFPWSLPMAAFLTLTKEGNFQSAIALGALGGLALAVPGILSLARREVL